MVMSKQTKKIVRFYSLAFFVGVIGFLISQSVGLSGTGFDVSFVLSQFSFYLAGGIFLLLLIVGFTLEMKIQKGDEKYGDSIAFASPGDNPALSFFKRFSNFQLGFLFVIIFGIMGLVAFLTKMETFTGVESLQMQFQPAAQILFSTTLIPASENLGLALVICTCLIGLRLFARKTNMSKASFRLFAIVFIPIIGGVYWLGNHLLRYFDQALSLMTVFLFGLMSSLLTVITGSFVVAWIFHISNNLFYDLRRFFASENILIWAMIIIFVLIVIYVILYRGRLFGEHKE